MGDGAWFEPEQVTFKGNLFETVWHDLTNDVPGTGGPVDVCDPVVGVQGYYRIKAKLQ
jgi:hypothetical protein